MAAIPGVSDVVIESEDESKLVLTYSYNLLENFDRINEHLANFDLQIEEQN